MIHLERLEAQLAQYFAGIRREFDLSLDLGGTPWQRRVWAALLDIPYGATSSYGQLALKLGKPGGCWTTRREPISSLSEGSLLSLPISTPDHILRLTPSVPSILKAQGPMESPDDPLKGV
ncbi:methylated-DNA--[protein]-cysteine S-methyltransferase [Gemmatimonadota bacterium]